MKRIERPLHRKSNNIDCRKYNEQYVKYFYNPNESTCIRDDTIFIDSYIKEPLKNEIVNSDIILSNFLNLGKTIYDSSLKSDIADTNYLYNRKILNGFEAHSFDEFIKFEIWKHPEIETIVCKWFDSNPYYGEFAIEDNRLCSIPINLTEFVIISVSAYMIYHLHIISKRNAAIPTKEYSLLSIFSDLIKTKSISKKLYFEIIKHMKNDTISKNCNLVYASMLEKYNKTKFHIAIFKTEHSDNTIVKIHDSLLSVVFESMASIIFCDNKPIETCSRCGNFYAGHGNSTLCPPCRTYRDNHKHVKSDRP